MAKIFKMLKIHLAETFPQDFPFYLILTYRVYSMLSVYDCEEFRTFIPMCINKFEAMDLKNIASVIITFLERYVYIATKFTRHQICN